MPQYRVTAPDGRVYTVSAPEGATPQQVQAYAQRQTRSGGQLPKLPTASKGFWSSAGDFAKDRVNTLAKKANATLSGLAGSWGDEIVGVGQAVTDGARDIAHGRRPHPMDSFRKGQRAHVKALDDYYREAPITYLASKGTGMFMGAKGLPAVKAPAALRASKAAKIVPALEATGTGAAYGFVEGLGQGEGWDRLKNGTNGLVAGSLLGYGLHKAIPKVVSAGRWAKDLVFPTTEATQRAAAQKVSTALASDGLSPAQAAQEVQRRARMGVPASVSDVGDQVRQVTGAASRGIGPGQKAVKDALGKRQEQMATRVRQHIDETLGVTADPHVQSAALSAQATAQARPLYEAAYAAPPQMTDELASLLATPAGREALRGAERAATNRRLPIEQTGLQFGPEGLLMPQAKLTPEGMDLIKRGLDDSLETYRNDLTGRLDLDETGRSIEDVRRSWLTEIDRLVPEYAEARLAAAGPLADRAAFRRGLSEVPGSNRYVPADARAQMARLTPSEVSQFRLGDRTRLADLVGNVGHYADATRPLTGTNSRLDLIREVHGEEAAQALTDRLQAEREAFLTYGTVHGGSPTAARQMVDGDGLPTVVTAAGQAARGNLLSAAVSLAGSAWQRTLGQHSQAVKAELADMLTNTDPQDVDATMRVVQDRLDTDNAFRARVQAAADEWGKGSAFQAVGNSGDDSEMYGPR